MAPRCNCPLNPIAATAVRPASCAGRKKDADPKPTGREPMHCEPLPIPSGEANDWGCDEDATLLLNIPVKPLRQRCADRLPRAQTLPLLSSRHYRYNAIPKGTFNRIY